MPLALVDRDPTAQVLETLRLVLSVYQDGSGQNQHPTKEDMTLPGWRDFERAVAFVFGGKAPRGREGKNVFDVWIPDPDRVGINFRLSCKMRGEWSHLQRTSRVTMELSNSAQKFWQRLSLASLTTATYKSAPRQVGEALINLVKEWHAAESMDNPPGTVDLTKSSYLSLTWSKSGDYQLHRFQLELPNPEMLSRYFPIDRAGTPAAHLNGDDASGGRVFEWYGESGGQLKYYPLASHAIWASPIFNLEPLPKTNERYSLYLKATTYFPQLRSVLIKPNLQASEDNKLS